MYSGSSIQTTRADAQLTCLGSGRFKDCTDIRVCNDAVKNICSAGILRKMGYELQLLRVPHVVRLSGGVEVIIAAYSESGMPYVGLSGLLHLPDISKCDRVDKVFLSDKVQMDPIELLHLRYGHVSKSKLLEGFKHMLFTGSGLSSAPQQEVCEECICALV